MRLRVRVPLNEPKSESHPRHPALTTTGAAASLQDGGSPASVSPSDRQTGRSQPFITDYRMLHSHASRKSVPPNILPLLSIPLNP